MYLKFTLVMSVTSAERYWLPLLLFLIALNAWPFVVNSAGLISTFHGDPLTQNPRSPLLRTQRDQRWALCVSVCLCVRACVRACMCVYVCCVILSPRQ